MRIARFDDDRFGLVSGEVLHDVTGVVEQHLPPRRYPFPEIDVLVATLPQLRPALEAAARTAPAVPLASVRLRSPVANPGKIVAAPVN
jgi:hypothetical protein